MPPEEKKRTLVMTFSGFFFLPCTELTLIIRKPENKEFTKTEKQQIDNNKL